MGCRDLQSRLPIERADKMISALYVVRNEEALLPKSISSIASLADELVVVDTGSVDATLRVAREAGNSFQTQKVFTYNWVNDFSKVRNFGLRHCTGDWVMYLDADEILDWESAAKIKSAVGAAKGNIGGFGVHILDYTSNWGETGHEQKPFFSSPQIRIFRRNRRVHFDNKVQESVATSLRKAGLATNVIDATIHHFLWRGKDEDYINSKIAYYRQLGANIQRIPVPPPAPQRTFVQITEPKALVQEVQMPEMPLMPQSNSKPVAIVMCAFNAGNVTRESLFSISKNTSHPYQLYLVDNGSRDDTAQTMRAATGREPIKLAKNCGVAKGRNLGAKDALSQLDADFICFMDNDTRVAPQWLDRMTKILRENPEVGAVGPLTHSASGCQNVSQHYSSSKCEDTAPLVATRDQEYFLADKVDGFCMLVRVEALRKIGMFDEGFGLYGCEADDFCIRLIQAKYKIAVANQVYVEHAGGVTVRANRINWHQVKYRAQQQFRQKWQEKPALSAPSAPSMSRHGRAPQSPIPQTRRERVSIVILTHNRLDITMECMEALFRHTANYELIVVDNGSTDGTPEWLAQRNIKVIRNSENKGVPVARNQGLREASCQYIVMMDNDVIVRGGWLEEYYDIIKSGADAVGLEAWQVNEGFAASRKCVKEGEKFDYLGGACCMFKRKVFEEVGLLDEGFSPAYYEDVDISFRARLAGLALAWKPTARLFHKEHSTLIFGQKTFQYTEALSQSYQRFHKKMMKQISVHHERLLPLVKAPKVLYLGMQWDYGVRERGYSFEHDNFYSSFVGWDKVKEFHHFDFVEIGKQQGIAKMSSMLLDVVQGVQPDVLFMIPFDENHDPRRETLRQISQTTPTKTIGWFCDSHFRYEKFDRPWADFLDFNVTTSTVALEKYNRNGLGSKVIKSQWAAAPKYKKLDVPLDVAVSFIGQPHGDRRAIIDKIRKAGIPVEVYGTGWERRLTFDEMLRMFNRSRINLNLNNSCDAQFKQIKGRNFEVPGCGGFLLTGVAENLNEYYGFGQEVAVYGSIDEMIELTRYYLKNEAERKAIAEAGHARTIREHTYGHRFFDIFTKTGVL